MIEYFFNANNKRGIILIGLLVLCQGYQLPTIRRRQSIKATTLECVSSSQSNNEHDEFIIDKHNERRNFIKRGTMGIITAVSTVTTSLPITSSASAANGVSGSGADSSLQQPKNRRIGGLASKIRGITVVMVR